MSVSSPTQSLCKRINRIKQAVDSESEALNKSLLATRLLIIEPLLQELGWDVQNQEMVEIEPQNETCIYRLNTDFGPWLELHCVAFEQPLAKPYYTSTNNVILTNGNTWLSLKHSHTSTLLQTTTFDFALTLIKHLDQQQTISSDTPVVSLKQISENIANMTADLNFLKEHLPQNQTTTRPIDNSVLAQSPNMPPAADLNRIMRKLQQQKAALPTPDDPRFVNLVEFSPPPNSRPLYLRLPNKQVVQINSWTRMLALTCEYLIEQSPDITLPLKDRAGKKVSLISLEPIPDNLGSSTVMLNDRTFHIYTNYDANNSVLNAQYVLSLLPDHAKQVDAAVIVQERE